MGVVIIFCLQLAIGKTARNCCPIQYLRDRVIKVLSTVGEIGGGPGEQRQAGEVHDGGAALLAELRGLGRVVVAEHVRAAQQQDAACWNEHIFLSVYTYRHAHLP